MKDLQFLKENLIAHRGVCYNYLENTLDAFRIAIIKNYTIELDIHLTKDNKIIVFHDGNLQRITGINKNIKDATYKEIKDIINIPTLKEALELVQGKVPIIIELKYANIRKKFEKRVVKLLDKYPGKFAIQSFNPLSILWFKLNRKKYIRGYLINSIFSDNILINAFLNNKLLNKILTPDYIGVNLSYLKNSKIKSLRSKYLIVGYTINTNKEYNDYYDYADNFICNIRKSPYKKNFNIPKQRDCSP